MKRQISRSDFSGTFSFFLFSVKRTLGITILLSAFALLICPSYLLILIQRILHDSRETVFAFRDTALAVTTGTSALSAIAVVFYLFLNFNFLYTKNASDFFHALPLKRSGMLLSRFFAAVVPLLIPVFLIYGSMLGMLALPYISGDPSVILIGLLYTVLLLLLTAALTLIFLFAASNAVDFLISLATFHFGSLFLHVMMEVLCNRLLRGFGSENSFPFYWIDPVYYGFEQMISDLGMSEQTGKIRLSFAPLILLALTVAMFVLCLFLYRRRKSEKSGQGYAFRFVYSICMTMVGVFGAFIVGNIFSDNRFDLSYWFFSAIGGVLTVIAYGAILNRGFKTVRRSAIIGGIAWALATVITLSFSVDLFGFVKRIPNADDIRYVEVTTEWAQDLRFYEPETVLALHKKAIPEPEVLDSTLSLCYVMKDGRKINRSFEISTHDVAEELLTLYKSEAHKEAIRTVAASFVDDLINLTVYEYDGDLNESKATEYNLTKRAFDEWLGFYLADLSHATEKSFSPSVTTCTVYSIDKKDEYRYLYLPIEPEFRNTLEALSSYPHIEN